MRFLRQSCFLFLSLTLQGAALAQLHEVGDGSAGPVKAAHVTAELKAGTPAGSAAEKSDIALVMQLDPGWHVYWIDAGDSGEPPSVQWVLPAGVTIGPMQFLTPKRLPLGPLMDYGYEGTAVFPFALSLARNAPIADVPPAVSGTSHTHIEAHVRWLVCREVCVPGKALLGIDLPRTASPETRVSGDLITSAIKSEPGALPRDESVQASATRDHLALTIETGQRESSAEFYPLNEDAL